MDMNEYRNSKIYKAKWFATHPALIFPFYSVMFILCAWEFTKLNGSIFTMLGALAGGFVFVTLFEYVFHRYLMHFKNRKMLIRQMHDIHHRVPEDHVTGTFPITNSLLLLVLITYPVHVMFNSATLNHATICGLIFGYLCHEFAHHISHSEYKGNNPIILFINEMHHVHHKVNPKANYGFMVPWWDQLFGTYQKYEKGN